MMIREAGSWIPRTCRMTIAAARKIITEHQVKPQFGNPEIIAALDYWHKFHYALNGIKTGAVCPVSSSADFDEVVRAEWSLDTRDANLLSIPTEVYAEAWIELLPSQRTAAIASFKHTKECHLCRTDTE